MANITLHVAIAENCIFARGHKLYQRLTDWKVINERYNNLFTGNYGASYVIDCCGDSEMKRHLLILLVIISTILTPIVYRVMWWWHFGREYAID